MKVGDLIKFSKWHSSRPGYEYCADWVGLIYGGGRYGSRLKVYWATGACDGITGEIPSGNNSSYEVVNESR